VLGLVSNATGESPFEDPQALKKQFYIVIISFQFMQSFKAI